MVDRNIPIAVRAYIARRVDQGHALECVLETLTQVYEEEKKRLDSYDDDAQLELPLMYDSPEGDSTLTAGGD